MELRSEEKEDYNEVEKLTREAFWDVYCPGCSEHLVLHKLRDRSSFVGELDYVAVQDQKIVGNIVYSRMYCGKKMLDDIIAFGPVSVHPDYQHRGIGKELIVTTLGKAEELGFKAVMITGAPEYYQRFGFESAGSYGIFAAGMEEGGMADYFMVKELEKGYLKTQGGVYGFDPCYTVDAQELEVFDQKFPPKKKREPRKGDLG